MKTMAGLETSSTAMVRRLRCSTDRPLWPGMPTRALRSPCMSTNANTCTTHDIFSALGRSGGGGDRGRTLAAAQSQKIRLPNARK